MATWLEDLTPKQRDVLDSFRSSVSDVLKRDHDDWFLLRWLRARKFDPKKAEEMLRKSLEWRATYGADTLLEDWDPPEILKNYYPGGVFGVDKQGHPILYQLSKDFDPKGMVRSTRKSDIVKLYVWRMEKMMKMCREQSAKLNKKIMGTMHISDLEGFGLSMAFAPGITEAMKEVFAIQEANYPEHLTYSYVINAPAAFPVIYNILRPFLSEETKKKVHILGKNWRPRLLEVIDEDQLPVYWGGTASEDDGADIYCQSHITIGKKIPTHLYLSEQPCMIDRDRMLTATIDRSAYFRLEYQVDEPGTILRWIYETDQYDIGFGILRYPQDKLDAGLQGKAAIEEVMETRRVDCHKAPEDGSITCTKRGKYILRFDNTYSWMNVKKLWYDVEIMPPASRDDTLIEKHTQQLDMTSLISETTHL